MRQRHGGRWARHMRIFAALIVFVTLAVSVLSACGEAERGTSAQSLRRIAPAPTASVRAAQRTIWRPAQGLSWQWQLEGNVNAGVDVAMYDIDLAAETSDGTSVAERVRRLHGQGKKVACYINVGAWENWRPDANAFPPAVIGKDDTAWPGEKWLDIRRLDLLAPLMRARFDRCARAGFDAIEPDNIDSYGEDTGFDLTSANQLAYNTWLANEAHGRGLSIALKNDQDQAAQLVSAFDWALDEDCFHEGWCDQLAPFLSAGKAVLDAEYTDTGAQLEQLCPEAKRLGISVILKRRSLDAWRQACA